jgi:hypothetical protein
MISKLQVKLSNFNVKYESEPAYIVVNPACIISIKSDIFKTAILKDIKIIISNRVGIDDFELY